MDGCLAKIAKKWVIAPEREVVYFGVFNCSFEICSVVSLPKMFDVEMRLETSAALSKSTVLVVVGSSTSSVFSVDVFSGAAAASAAEDLETEEAEEFLFILRLPLMIEDAEIGTFSLEDLRVSGAIVDELIIMREMKDGKNVRKEILKFEISKFQIQNLLVVIKNVHNITVRNSI